MFRFNLKKRRRPNTNMTAPKYSTSGLGVSINRYTPDEKFEPVSFTMGGSNFLNPAAIGSKDSSVQLNNYMRYPGVDRTRTGVANGNNTLIPGADPRTHERPTSGLKNGDANNGAELKFSKVQNPAFETSTEINGDVDAVLEGIIVDLETETEQRRKDGDPNTKAISSNPLERQDVKISKGKGPSGTLVSQETQTEEGTPSKTPYSKNPKRSPKDNTPRGLPPSKGWESKILDDKDNIDKFGKIPDLSTFRRSFKIDYPNTSFTRGDFVRYHNHFKEALKKRRRVRS